MSVVQGAGNDYPGLETSGERWLAFTECLARLADAVRCDPVCESWLASSVGLDGLREVFDNPEKYFAVASHFLNKDGTVDNGTDASTDDVPGYRAIINYADFAANSTAYNWDTIIHELAHILDCQGFHQNDGGDDAAAETAQEANAELIRRHCGRIFAG
jgi:Mlc titration factor MtfA (ptsG expression regulator)